MAARVQNISNSLIAHLGGRSTEAFIWGTASMLVAMVAASIENVDAFVEG